MCYPPPGPRCSSHANAEWLKTLALLEKETNTSKRIRLQMKANEAYRAFNSTPRGQNRLLREINSLADTPENRDEIAKLSLHLRDGQLTRKNQLAAFFSLKNNKESSIKSLLQTSNKQEQAVGIAFHVLMKFLPEAVGDTTHIITNNLIQSGDYKILCLPQKHQRSFGVIREEADGYLSSADFPAELLDIFADFPEPSTITPNHIPKLVSWLIQSMKDQGVLFLASVDVKTENVVFERIDSLSDCYDASFISNKKLGGTAPYIHGDTDVLKNEIQGTPFENCAITVAKVKDQKRTYILDTPYVEPNDVPSSIFHFTQRETPEGIRFHEVRTRHQSCQQEIFIRLSRKLMVIPRMEEMLVKKFIFDNFGPDESSVPEE